MRTKGMEDDADRLAQNGEAGYPEEPDFSHIAAAAGIAFQVILEAAPMMQPLRYGTGEPQVRVKLLKTYDGAKVGNDHYDVDALLKPLVSEMEGTDHTAVCSAKRWRRSAPGKSQADISNTGVSIAEADTTPPEIKRRRIWNKNKIS